MNKKSKLNYFDTEVNVRECLEWLTAKADLRVVRNSDLVSPHFDLLVKMAQNEADVYDKSTWTSEDENNDLATLFHTKICGHSSQGQKIKSMV